MAGLRLSRATGHLRYASLYIAVSFQLCSSFPSVPIVPRHRSRSTSPGTSQPSRKLDIRLYGCAIRCTESTCRIACRTWPETDGHRSCSTLTSSSGLKTRHFGTVISELNACIRAHAQSGSRLGGVSLEFTGELTDDGFSVTECLGGSMGLSEDQLPLRYQV